MAKRAFARKAALSLIVGGAFLIAYTRSADGHDRARFHEEAPKADSPKVVVESVAGYSSTYTTTVYLTKGARVKPILGTGPLDPGSAGCRGWVNRFEALSVASFTKKDSATNASLLVSGSFHDDRGRPAFPLRINTWRATYGAACSVPEGIKALLMLTIRNSEKRAYISSFSLTSFNSSSIAPDVVVGLKPDFPKSPDLRTGRNYVGVMNPYNQGYGTVIFLTAKAMTQSEAVKVLKAKGCTDDQIMQLDGSTTAQLSKKNANGTWSHLLTAARIMPQAFAIEG